MHSLEPELRELHDAGVLDDAAASRAIALDRGEVFSIHDELRAAMYVAVALITTGIGIVLKNNIDRLGPITIIAALALASAACYAVAIRARVRGRPRSIGGDYTLLLGALIASATLGYAEAQFHWLGVNWSRHLLVLAVFHAITAYVLDSRLVLSVSLTSLATWLGVERSFGNVFELENASPQIGMMALICSGIVVLWRETNRRLGVVPQFQDVFDHFAANLSFWAALAWCFDDFLRIWGVILVAAFAAISIRLGLRTSNEMFVVYGIVYSAVGLSIVVCEIAHEPLLAAFAMLLIAIAASVLLWHFHSRMKESPS